MAVKKVGTLIREARTAKKLSQEQLASGIDLIVHLGRLRDRSRKVLEIAEVTGMEDGQITLSTLYRFTETGEENGKITGIWSKENEITHRFKFEMAGIPV